MFDIESVRADFPILLRQINGKPLTYLDSGASAQKPHCVIEAISQLYSHQYANVHRGLHTLSNELTDNYEAARQTIASFLGAEHMDEILLTRGTTEAINLIAYSYLQPRIRKDDEIILSVLEHHSNIVPWHFLRERHGARLIWLTPDERGEITPEMLAEAITPRTSMIALTHMSNVLGTILDAEAICRVARDKNVPVLLDGSQAAVHMPVDVSAIGCDFYAITGHKLYGPSGSGALYAARGRQEQMQPWHGGGNMISEVTDDKITYAESPHKFEAGTPPIAQIIGFAVALNYIEKIGWTDICNHEKQLYDYAKQRLQAEEGVTLFEGSAHSGAIFSFTLAGMHPHDISTIVDRYGVAVRAGHHCAQPLMRNLGVSATCRASLALYNRTEDIDQLMEALACCKRLLG